jgi:hypothetical protein
MRGDYVVKYVKYPPPPKQLSLPGDIEVAFRASEAQLIVFFGAPEEQAKRGEISARTHGEAFKFTPAGKESWPVMESDVALRIKLHDVAGLLVSAESFTHELYGTAVLHASLVRGAPFGPCPFIIQVTPPQMSVAARLDARVGDHSKSHIYFHSLKTRIDARVTEMTFDWIENPYRNTNSRGELSPGRLSQ